MKLNTIQRIKTIRKFEVAFREEELANRMYHIIRTNKKVLSGLFQKSYTLRDLKDKMGMRSGKSWIDREFAEYSTGLLIVPFLFIFLISQLSNQVATENK